MEISKKELRKISRKFRTLASNVMNSYCEEQNANLTELIIYCKQTPLIYEYLQRLAYDIDGLDNLLNAINNSYGREALDLGTNSDNRTYLLYKAFSYITENELKTYNFGWYYAHSNKYQDMAKAFGDRLVYPFAVEIENYMKDIATDMGYDDNNSLYNINVNSTGVQVNIAEHGSTIKADQKNKLNSEEIVKAIQEVRNLIKKIENEDTKTVLNQNLDTIKNEINQKQPKKDVLISCLKNMQFIATSIALLPDLSQGIKMIGSAMGIVF